MGDVISGAAQEIWSIFVEAATNPGPWLVAGAVLLLAAVAALARGKLTSPWLWIPVLGATGLWVLRHFSR